MQRSTKVRCALRVIAGGHKLPRVPEQYTAGEVLRLSEESLANLLQWENQGDDYGGS